MRFKPAALIVALVIGFFAGRASDGIHLPDVIPHVIPAVVPVPTEGLRVFVLRSTEDETKPLPTASASFREYVKAKGGTYRAFDDETPEDELAKLDPWHRAVFEKAVKDSKGVRPWLVAVNGTKGINEAMPADPLARLKTIGGE